MPSSALQEIVEYRGVEGLVAAEILTAHLMQPFKQAVNNL